MTTVTLCFSAMQKIWLHILLLGWTGKGGLSKASTCTFDRFLNQTSFGPAAVLVQQPPYPLTAAWNALIAFSADHCSSLCCQEPNCAAAVFDISGALCYLKNSEAAASGTFSAAAAIDVYVIRVRTGQVTPAATVPSGCSRKKGIAGHLTAAQARLFGSALAWHYNWGSSVPPNALGTASLEFVPMAWTIGPLDTSSWSGIKHLLSFNEPNFHSQSNLTPTQAAQAWPGLQAAARNAGVIMTGPAMNFCGPASECVNMDPFAWFQQFLDSCSLIGGCEFSAVAFHSYTCSIEALNKFAHQYHTLFGKPLWLTEFACADDKSVDQRVFVQKAVLYLELNPHIERYAFFSEADSSGSIVGNVLFNSTGLTPVGELYRSLYVDQQACTSPFTYVGCFIDQQPRALSGPYLQSDSMSIQLCATFCHSYPFFATEWGRECYCGQTVPPNQVTNNECSMTCSGNAQEMCGNGWRLSAFRQL